MKIIYIKPHHLLDIFKLYGKGIEVFVPNDNYGHDFYRVANKIVNCEADTIIFKIGSDDICKPCKHNKNNSCDDFVSETNLEKKEDHNNEIDNILVKILEIEFEKPYDFNKIISLLLEKLEYSTFEKAWDKASKEELDFRYNNTICGLKKCLNR